MVFPVDRDVALETVLVAFVAVPPTTYLLTTEREPPAGDVFCKP